MSKIEYGQRLKIKHGARLFFNLNTSSLKFKNGKWIISQVAESVYQQTKQGCYTKKVNFDGTVYISDPEVVFGDEWIFCEIVIDDKNCFVLREDLIIEGETQQNLKPAREWNF